MDEKHYGDYQPPPVPPPVSDTQTPVDKTPPKSPDSKKAEIVFTKVKEEISAEEAQAGQKSKKLAAKFSLRKIKLLRNREKSSGEKTKSEKLSGNIRQLTLGWLGKKEKTVSPQKASAKAEEQKAAPKEIESETPPETSEPISNKIKGKISVIKQETSYSESGAKVRGHKKFGLIKSKVEVVQLKGLNDPRFAIKTTKPSGWGSNKDLISLTVGDQQVYVNAKELAVRLHLKLEDVKDHANKGTLNKLITQKQVQIKSLDKIISNYERILNKSRGFKGKGKLTPAVLMKVIRTAVENDNLKPESQKGRGMLIAGEDYLKGKKIIAGFKGDKLYLANIAKQKKLGSGAFGEAFAVQSMASGHDKVIKYALDQEAAESLHIEIELLEKLHKNYPGGGYVPGLQKPPFSVVSFTESGEQKTGLFETRYDSLTDGLATNLIIFADVRKRVSGFQQMLEGLDYLHTKHNFVHRDIKPGNVFFQVNPDGTLDCRLADIGEGKLLNDPDLELDPSGTLSYLSNDDVEAFEFSKEIYDIEALKKLEAKKDVFSMGVLCYNMLVLSSDPEKPVAMPFKVNSAGYPDPNTLDLTALESSSELPSGAGKEFADLIRKTLDFNYETRPTLSEFKKEYDALVDKHNLGQKGLFEELGL